MEIEISKHTSIGSRFSEGGREREGGRGGVTHLRGRGEEEGGREGERRSHAGAAAALRGLAGQRHSLTSYYYNCYFILLQLIVSERVPRECADSILLLLHIH